MADNSEAKGSVGRAAVVALISQTAILAGSLFYFGYIRALSTFRYFGVDVSLLNFSATDYILRSGPAVFLPVVAFSLFYTYFACMSRIYELIRDLPCSLRRRWVFLITLAVTVVMTIAIAVFVLRNLIVSTALLLIATSSAISLLGFTLTKRSETNALARSIIAPVFLLGATLFFLANSLQAQEVGVAAALAVEDGSTPVADVELYSEKHLAIGDTDGVSTSMLQVADGKYKYKVVGLKLLIVSGGQYFLRRSHPHQSPGDVVIVPVGQDVRVSVRKSQGT